MLFLNSEAVLKLSYLLNLFSQKLIICDFIWQSRGGNFTRNIQDMFPWYEFESYKCKITAKYLSQLFPTILDETIQWNPSGKARGVSLNFKIWSIPCTILYKSCLSYPSWQTTSFERPPLWMAFIEGFHCIPLYLIKSIPQVICSSIGHVVLLEVILQSLLQAIATNHTLQHADDGCSLK